MFVFVSLNFRHLYSKHKELQCTFSESIENAVLKVQCISKNLSLPKKCSTRVPAGKVIAIPIHMLWVLKRTVSNPKHMPLCLIVSDSGPRIKDEQRGVFSMCRV